MNNQQQNNLYKIPEFNLEQSDNYEDLLQTQKLEQTSDQPKISDPIFQKCTQDRQFQKLEQKNSLGLKKASSELINQTVSITQIEDSDLSKNSSVQFSQKLDSETLIQTQKNNSETLDDQQQFYGSQNIQQNNIQQNYDKLISQSTYIQKNKDQLFNSYDKDNDINHHSQIKKQQIHLKIQKDEQIKGDYEHLHNQDLHNITSMVSSQLLPQLTLKSKPSQQIKDEVNQQEIEQNLGGIDNILRRVRKRILIFVKGLNQFNKTHSDLTKIKKININILQNDYSKFIRSNKAKNNTYINQNSENISKIPKSSKSLEDVPEFEIQNQIFFSQVDHELKKSKTIYQFKFRKISCKSRLKIGLCYNNDINNLQNIFQKQNFNEINKVFILNQDNEFNNFKLDEYNTQIKQDIQQKNTFIKDDDNAFYDIIQVQFIENDICKVTFKNSFEFQNPKIFFTKVSVNPNQNMYFTLVFDDIKEFQSIKIEEGNEFKDPTLKLLGKHWLEASDPKHRYGNYLVCYFDYWKQSNTKQSFFYWLDYGEGKHFSDKKCDRQLLESTGVKYLCTKEREVNRAVIRNGIFYFKRNWQIVDTTEPQEGLDADDEDQKWIFVVSLQYKLYIHPKIRGKFHHTSFLGGGPVISAGNLVISKGILKEIKPHSGHYMPDIDNFNRYLWILEKYCKVDLKNVEIGTVKDPTKKKVKTKY